MATRETKTLELADLLARYTEARVKRNLEVAQNILLNIPQALTQEILETGASLYLKNSKRTDEPVVMSMLKALVNNYESLPDEDKMNIQISMFDYLAYSIMNMAKDINKTSPFLFEMLSSEDPNVKGLAEELLRGAS